MRKTNEENKFLENKNRIDDPDSNQPIHYENFFNLNLDMLCIGDRNGRFLKLNKEWESILGYQLSELENRRFIDFLHPEDVVPANNELEKLKDEFELSEFISRFRAKDGTYHYFEWKVRPQGDYIYGAARDITERIELEKSLQEKNAMIESIIDNAPLGIWITDPEAVNSFTNKYVNDNFAITEEEHIQCRRTNMDALQKDGPQRYDEIITFKDGKKHVIETVKTKLLRKDGRVLGVLGFGLDITKRKEGEEALRISEEKYRLLTETSSDLIWVLNMTTRKITYVSSTVHSMIGYSVEEIMDRTVKDIISQDSYDSFITSLENILQEFLKKPNLSKSSIIEMELICKDGRSIWTEVSAKFRYTQNREIEMVGVSRNIEKRKKYEKEVLYLSYHDQLTGLYNRRFYEEELKHINREENYPISLVMSDVNGLKLTNDAFGHVLGDKLLITFAEILKQECRSGDIIARTGGDEFVLLLPRTNSIQAEKIIERIRDVVNRTMIEKVMLSVSFGSKTKYSEEEEFDDIYKFAEDAMYRSKLCDGKSYKSDTIKMITKSLYEKSPREQAHSKRVSDICKKIGSEMGMNENDIIDLGLAGLLHDIGKIGISEKILNKKDYLTESESEEMKRHPEIGYQILRSVNEFADIAEFVLAHHERYDGNGYPKGLKNDEILLKSKILLIAEAYDEMIGGYESKHHFNQEEAIKELIKNAGILYDPQIVEVLAKKFDRKDK